MSQQRIKTVQSVLSQYAKVESAEEVRLIHQTIGQLIGVDKHEVGHASDNQGATAGSEKRSSVPKMAEG
jgi:pyruvoyl-dependent arginine decarboxylase (PvlArgDC)